MSPTLIGVFREALRPRNYRVTLERIEALLAGARCRIRGYTVPVSGEAAGLRAGRLVPVAWVDGRPTLVFAHTRRKEAEPAETVEALAATRGLVEELFIGPETAGSSRLDVWFRNDLRAEPLGVRSALGANPESVKWGQGRDSFVVKAGLKFSIFQFPRGPEAVLDELPTPIFLRTEDLAAANLAVGTVPFVYERRGKRTWGNVEVAGQAPPVNRLDSFTILPKVTTPDNSDQQASVAVRLTGAMLAGGENFGGAGLFTASVADYFLDEQRALFVVFRIGVAGFDPRPPGNLSAGLTGSFQLHEINPDSSCPAPLVSQPLTPLPAFNISEGHVVVANWTKQLVVWSTLGTTSRRQAVKADLDALGAQVKNLHLLIKIVFTEVGGRTLCQGLTKEPVLSGAPRRIVALGDIGQAGVSAWDRDLFTELAFLPARGTWYQTQQVVHDESLSFNQLLFDDSIIHYTFRWTEVDARLRHQWAIHAAIITVINGNPLLLVSVTRLAQLTGEQTEHGVFVFTPATGTVLTLLPLAVRAGFPGSLDAAPAQLQTANARRLLWDAGGTVYMTSLDTGVTAVVGTDVASFLSHLLRLTAPDFLYALAESERFFVVGWDDATGAITLSQSQPGFPVKDLELDGVDGLLDLSAAVAGAVGNRTLQTINDAEILIPLDRFEAE